MPLIQIGKDDEQKSKQQRKQSSTENLAKRWIAL